MFQLQIDLLLFFIVSNAILNCLDATLRTKYTAKFFLSNILLVKLKLSVNIYKCRCRCLETEFTFAC